ncbi:MAG: methyltransferase type 11 [Solibacterales bacterium]|nr:methyltransferase type 11 [Bryobacterales bacterium]|tara:strand:+ start:5839 stop:6366 length:528 start_codon:yes stop_codon:yes gene_type:complete
MTLDLGCGRNKCFEAFGVDNNPDTDADVIADIDSASLPFLDNSFDRVLLVHTIEHVDNVINTIEEVHRLTRPGGTIVIETPHYTDFSSFCDPTHRWHLNTFSFRYFSDNHGGFGYYSRCRLREKKIQVKLLRLWRFLGLEFVINHCLIFRKFWEHYLCFVIRGKVMVLEFEVLDQ